MDFVVDDMLNTFTADDANATTGKDITIAGGTNISTSISGNTITITNTAAGGGGETIDGWIQFNGTGVIAIQDSYNVTSITDNGTGKYTITWDTDFANDDYAVCVTSGPSGLSGFVSFVQTIATDNVQIRGCDTGGTYRDAAYVFVIAIGD